ncbi:MAG TPA: S8 family serine peptidase, partial [Myxococcota bacterium]
MRLPRLPAVSALLIAAFAVSAPALAAATRSPAVERFNDRAWYSADATGPVAVVATARKDLFAVRVPGAADDAAVASIVEQLLTKVPGVDAGIAAVIHLDGEVVGLHLSAMLQPAQAALLGKLLHDTVDGRLWPALGRGPVGDNGIPAGRAFFDDRLIVTAAPGQLDAVLQKLVTVVDATDIRRSRVPDTALVRVGAVVADDAITAALLLKDFPGVVAAEPNLQREYATLATVDDPLFNRQWHLGGPREQEDGSPVPGTGEIFADDAWDTTKGDSDIVIAVFDSGTDWQHPDLIDNVRQDLMFDASGNDADPSPECESSQDGNGRAASCPPSSPYRESHGTSVSGTIAAKGDNGLGVSGVCPQCSLAPVRLLGEDTGNSLSTAEAFVRACDSGVDAINNSWGPGFSLFFPLSRAERDAF